jgi:GTP pyrophosphokinase
MVSVVQLHPQSAAAALEPLAAGLAAPERALLGRALEFAEPLYAGQLLSTGEPAWGHALGLAASLAALGLDAPGRAAGVLFAAPKYLDGTEKLQAGFGEEVAALVDGVTKLTGITFQSRDEAQAENYRKMMVAMATDIRVILIKLADRLHNMRTLEALAKQKQIEKAKETLEI